jgi:hypothetical protein
LTSAWPASGRRRPRHRLTTVAALAFLAAAWLGAVRDTVEAADFSAVLFFETAAGVVEFLHEMHASDFGIDCAECHHETHASALVTPHPDYLEDSSIDCAGCHHESVDGLQPRSCSHCHHDTPTDIADESLSPKVVIHEVCWQCHAVGRGQAASRSCSTCHQENEEVG